MRKISPSHRRLIAIPALTVVLGALAIVAAQWAKHEAALLRDARTQLERRIQEGAAHATHDRQSESLRARMQAWRHRGLFEVADRFRWIDAVGRARHAAQLRSVDYEVASVEAPASSRNMATGSAGSRLAEMRMTVRLRLADEAQLLTFLSTLEAEPGGMLCMRTCEIRQVTVASDASTPLEAQCELSVWNARPVDQT